MSHEYLKKLQARIDAMDDAISALKAIKSAAEMAYAETVEEVIKIMLEDGVFEDTYFKIRKSESVEIIGDIPLEYSKATWTPDKVKIKKELPQANWYIIKTNHNLKVK